MKLIFHADDFGLNQSVNRAIVDAAQRGVLKSASIIVNGMAAEGAIAEAPGAHIDAGIHLNIVRGRPLSPQSEVRTLVDGEGKFFNSVFKLMIHSALGRIDVDEVYREYRRQVLFMIERGLPPTHFDGEKHSHLLIPEAALAAGRLMDEFSISRVRTINERQFIKLLNSYKTNVNIHTGRRAGLFFLEYRSRQAKEQWRRFKSPDYTFGIGTGGAASSQDAAKILHAILNLPAERSVEWILHPGYRFDYQEEEFRKHYGTFHSTGSRIAEADFLLSDETTEGARTYASCFISYGDL